MCHRVWECWFFIVKYCCHLQGFLQCLKLKALYSFKISVTTYPARYCHIPEDMDPPQNWSRNLIYHARVSYCLIWTVACWQSHLFQQPIMCHVDKLRLHFALHILSLHTSHSGFTSPLSTVSNTAIAITVLLVLPYTLKVLTSHIHESLCICLHYTPLKLWYM